MSLSNWIANLPYRPVIRTRGFGSDRMVHARFPKSKVGGFLSLSVHEFTGGRLAIESENAEHRLVLLHEGPPRSPAVLASFENPRPAWGTPRPRAVIASFDDPYLAEVALSRLARAIAPSPWRWLWRGAIAFVVITVVGAKPPAPPVAQSARAGAVKPQRAVPTDPQAAQYVQPVQPGAMVRPREPAPAQDSGDPFGLGR